MKKQYSLGLVFIIFTIFSFAFINSISALDNQTYISCGGDAELVIGCLDDNENTILSNTLAGGTKNIVSNPPTNVTIGNWWALGNIIDYINSKFYKDYNKMQKDSEYYLMFNIIYFILIPVVFLLIVFIIVLLLYKRRKNKSSYPQNVYSNNN